LSCFLNQQNARKNFLSEQESALLPDTLEEMPLLEQPPAGSACSMNVPTYSAEGIDLTLIC
jgi:hypothetical protein